MKEIKEDELVTVKIVRHTDLGHGAVGVIPA